MLQEIPLTKITVGERHRKDLGDIVGLAASIEVLGLLHPIVVTGDYTLIVGRRRLAAFAHMQRATIPALVVDLDQPLKAELDENDQRKDFTPSERVGIAEAILAQSSIQAKERQRTHGKTAPGRKKNTSDESSEVLPQATPARDGDAAGVTPPRAAAGREPESQDGVAGVSAGKFTVDHYDPRSKQGCGEPMQRCPTVNNARGYSYR